MSESVDLQALLVETGVREVLDELDASSSASCRSRPHP